MADGNIENDVAMTMVAILGSMVAVIVGLVMIQTPKTNNNNDNESSSSSRFLPDPITEPSKRSYEIFALVYTPIWITGFAIIVGLKLYENFDEWSYMKVCVGLALPFLLQPILLPSGIIIMNSSSSSSPDANRPMMERYSFKANLWLAVYSFIGNYWYTHYFYSVLNAKYTMPAHRLNNVPIALYFATHFYFSTYHVFSNMMLRKIVTTFQENANRKLLYITAVGTFAYFTAFMETLTISAYPDYSFENRNMAYTIGSAFYGIYFIVSFPAFFVFDTDIDHNNDQHNNKVNDKKIKDAAATDATTTRSTDAVAVAVVVTAWDTIVSSCGYGMMIMILLDVVRLYLDIPLIVGSSTEDICSSPSSATQ